MAKKEAKKKEVKKDTTVKENEKVSVKDRVKDIRLSLLKSFGDNAVIEGADLEKANFGRISTGSLKLDVELGGGVPIGRIIQIAGNKSDGKSTLTDIIASNAQKQRVDWIWTRRGNEKGREVVEEVPKVTEGLIVGFLDAEGHKTIDWTRDTLGVDTDNWIYTQPSGAEEAFDIAHQMQLDGVNLIILDSIDSIVPTKLYEKDFGDSAQMGIKAKLIGDFLRKFTMTNNKLFREGRLPCTLILINQVREKIGCFHYNSKVLLEDGTTESIGKIVNNKLPLTVMSYNERTGELEPKRITNWFDNGVADEPFLTIKTDKPQTNGFSSFSCTPNHLILTPYGYVKAEELKVGDKVIQTLPNYTKREAIIVSIEEKEQDEYTHKYDLEVEDNHNYIVSNIIVHNSYGDPLFTPGGKALDFYTSIDLRLRRGDWITEGTGDNKVIVGQVIKFKTHKNKTYKQQRSGEFDFYFDSTSDGSHAMGTIDNFKSIIILGVEYGVIERAGAWFRYKGQQLAQGAENTVTYLKHHMDTYELIKKELFELILTEEEE